MSKRSDLEVRIRAAVEAPGHDELSVEAKIQAAVEAYNKEFPIKDEAIAITRDGKIYHGRSVEPKIRNKYIEKLIWWIGKAYAFFFMRLLRLPYLMDLMRGNRKNNRKTTRR